MPPPESLHRRDAHRHFVPASLWESTRQKDRFSPGTDPHHGPRSESEWEDGVRLGGEMFHPHQNLS